MTTEEINTFIETMEEFGDPWTVDQVKDVYGDKSLEDAKTDRKATISMFDLIIATVMNR